MMAKMLLLKINYSTNRMNGFNMNCGFLFFVSKMFVCRLRALCNQKKSHCKDKLHFWIFINSFINICILYLHLYFINGCECVSVIGFLQISNKFANKNNLLLKYTTNQCDSLSFFVSFRFLFFFFFLVHNCFITLLR